MAEQLTLFDVEDVISLRQKKTSTVADFLAKFTPKNGSDECFTPPHVYEAIKGWVLEQHPSLIDKEIIRPFKPNGDFTAEDYNDKIVIDNPPFSILGKIINFYNDNNILYFLFAPCLSVTHYYGRCDIIICDTAIIYANGANVSTAFCTNFWGDNRIILSGELKRVIDEAQGKRKRKRVPRNLYPYALSGARLQKFVPDSGDIIIKQEDTLPLLPKVKRNVFGDGLYVRKGVLPTMNAPQEITPEEALYFNINNFEPIC